MLSRLFKKKYYYISYQVGVTNNMVCGCGTYEEKGLPDLERYIKDIHNLPENKGKDVLVIILSCIECREDFIK